MRTAPRAQNAAEGREEKTRQERLIDMGIDAELPPVSCGDYLIEFTLKAGPVKSGGMGPVPLEEPDIGWFQKNRGIELWPVEVEFIRALSAAYASESHKAMKPDCPSPWDDAPYLSALAGQAMRNTLRGMMK